MWKYDIKSKLWTWVAGSIEWDYPRYINQGVQNADARPGAREGASSWVDKDGKFWMFGGYGFDYEYASSQSYFNDLWMFDPENLEWTWWGGRSERLFTSNYGTQGVPASTNWPSGRSYAATWIDSNGDFWMYGGEISYNRFKSDTWKFAMDTKQWGLDGRLF